MRYNSKINPRDAKRIARQKYGERQIDKWWRWSWEKRGRVKYKELVKDGKKTARYAFGKDKVRR